MTRSWWPSAPRRSRRSRGALTFRGQEDVEAVRGLVDDVSHRGLRGAGVEMAIVVPAGCGWPLAAYELALMTREHLGGRVAGNRWRSA